MNNDVRPMALVPGHAVGANQCLQPSPVVSNTTNAHDRLSGVLAVLTTKENKPNA